MQSKIQEALHRENINSITVTDVCASPHPFLGLETEYKQLQYFKDNLQLLVRMLISSKNIKTMYIINNKILRTYMNVNVVHTMSVLH